MPVAGAGENGTWSHLLSEKLNGLFACRILSSFLTQMLLAGGYE
jgi:hypothetical protein